MRRMITGKQAEQIEKNKQIAENSVHLTGNQSIAGLKTFTSNISTNEVRGINASGNIIKLKDENNALNIQGESIYIGSEEINITDGNSASVRIENGSVLKIEADGIEIDPDFAGNDSVFKVAEGALQVSYKGVEIANLNAAENIYFKISGLPTSNPQIAGVVWNDNGVLKISAGE